MAAKPTIGIIIDAAVNIAAKAVTIPGPTKVPVDMATAEPQAAALTVNPAKKPTAFAQTFAAPINPPIK